MFFPFKENPAPEDAGRQEDVPENVTVAEAVKSLKKEQVKTLVTQLKSLAASDAGEKVLLVTLDSLIDIAVQTNHPELAFYQNLRAHCLRVKELVPVAAVIMEVLATKQEDKILSVVQKLCKESKAVKVPTQVKRKAETSTLSGEDANVMGPHVGLGAQFQPMMPFPQYGWQGYPFQMPATHFPGVQMGFQGSQFLQQGVRPPFKKKKPTCYTCGEEGHISRDCAKKVVKTE